MSSYSHQPSATRVRRQALHRLDHLFHLQNTIWSTLKHFHTNLFPCFYYRMEEVFMEALACYLHNWPKATARVGAKAGWQPKYSGQGFTPLVLFYSLEKPNYAFSSSHQHSSCLEALEESKPWGLWATLRATKNVSLLRTCTNYRQYSIVAKQRDIVYTDIPSRRCYRGKCVPLRENLLRGPVMYYRTYLGLELLRPGTVWKNMHTVIKFILSKKDKSA